MVGALLSFSLMAVSVRELLRTMGNFEILALRSLVSLVLVLAVLPRFTESAVTIAGVAIPANSWLLYGNGPAGHDPDEFPMPEIFSLDRGQNRHLAFNELGDLGNCRDPLEVETISRN